MMREPLLKGTLHLTTDLDLKYDWVKRQTILFCFNLFIFLFIVKIN